jgi:hypothetical protein
VTDRVLSLQKMLMWLFLALSGFTIIVGGIEDFGPGNLGQR